MLTLNTMNEKAVAMWLARAMDLGRFEFIDLWAENKIVLTEQVTPFPGPLKLSRFPYQRGILRGWQDTRYKQTWLIWGAQNGKTLLVQVVMGYVIDQEPGPLMIAFPDQNTARRRSKKHLKPFITESPVLARHLTGRKDDFANFMFALDRCTINLGWAGSGSVLASEPIQYGIGDEVAKWEHRDKKEAHPIYLFLRRLTAFGELAKGLFVTTPNTEDRPGWAQLERGTYHEYFVPCPNCGKPELLDEIEWIEHDRTQKQLAKKLAKAGYQVLQWDNFTGWGESRDPDEVGKLAGYECEHCGKLFYDEQKPWFLPRGKWIPRKVGPSLFTSHLPAWYSPQKSFGECCAEFFSAQGDPEALKDWINSVKAWAWKETGVEKTTEEIKAHCVQYPAGTIAFRPLCITLVVDVQQNEFFYKFGSWGLHEGYAMIEHGMLPRIGRPDDDEIRAAATRNETVSDPSFKVLDRLRNRTFYDINGDEYGVDLMGIDSSWDTTLVYDYCRPRNMAFPLKGEDGQKMALQYSQPETVPGPGGKRKPAPDSVYLVTFSTPFFRDLLARKLEIPVTDPGAWWLPEMVDDEFCYQMVGDIKVQKRNRFGRPVWVWKTVHRNHYADCSVMELALARFAGVREMEYTEETETEPTQPGPADKGADWVRMGRT